MVSTYHSSGGLRKSKSVDKTVIELHNYKSMATTAYSDSFEDGYIKDYLLDSVDYNDTVKPLCEVTSRQQGDLQRCHVGRYCPSTCHTRGTPKSAMKHVARRNVFRKWAKSYHSSVRDSVAHEIAHVYYTKHHSEAAFKALTTAVRSRRIKEAKREADMFALRVVICRWRDIAVNSETTRCNTISAGLFYQTSLAVRAFRSFKMEVQRRKNSQHCIDNFVQMMEKWLLRTCIVPLRNHAEQAKRMEKCTADIARNHDINIKNAAITALHSAYRCCAASEQLEALSKRTVMRQALHQIVSGHRSLTEKETLVGQAIRRETAVNALDCWKYATKEKHASHYYDFILKYKAFSAFNCNRAQEMPPSPKSCEAQGDIVEECKGTSTIKTAVCQKRNIIMGIGLMDKTLQRGLKRAAIKALVENVKIVATELLKEQQIIQVSAKCLFKTSLKAWKQYMEVRQEKANVKRLGDMNYKTILLSRSFDALRKCYIDKLEAFDDALLQFKNRQRILHQRMYFVAFVSGCERSRSLRVAQGVIENLHQSQTRSTVLEKFEGLSAQVLLRKLSCIASIGNMDVNLAPDEAHDILITFRNIVFRKRCNGRGIFNTFMEHVLSANIMATVTMPLRTESIVFLYFISGLKTRAFELMEELELRPDDTVLRVCQSLTSDELAELHSAYAYQLYVVRLEGLPSLNAGSGNAPATHRKDDNTVPCASEGHSSRISEGPNGDVVRGPRAVVKKTLSSGKSDEPGLSCHLDGVPEWLVALLQQLTLVKLCKPDDMRIDEYGSFDRDYTAFDLLCSGLPLWRLTLTKFHMGRSGSAFRAWKNFTQAKKVRDSKMSEISASMEGLFNMSVLMKSFRLWLDAARTRGDRKIAENNKKCELFTSILGGLVYRSVSIVFMRLHLKRIMYTHTGGDRLQQMRTLAKAVVISCREDDATTEIAYFRSYAMMSKHFVEWRMHTQWNMEVTSKATDFYRTVFLRKGWDVLYNILLNRRERRKQLESSLDDGLRIWCIKYNFDAWHKAASCRKVFASLNPPPLVMLLACFRRWKYHVRNASRLASLCETMQGSSDMRILQHAFKGIVNEFSKRRSLEEFTLRVRDTYRNNLLHTVIKSWRFAVNRHGILESIHNKIKDHADIMRQRHVLGTMHKLTVLKAYDTNRVKHMFFGFMALYTASVKVTKMLDRRLTLSQKDACREFFVLQLSIKDNEETYKKMLTGKGRVYGALVALSTLQETRASLGIEALHQNVIYNNAIRKVRKLHDCRVLSSFFKSWRRWTAYNVRTSQYNISNEKQKNGGYTSARSVNTGECEDTPAFIYAPPSEEDIDRYMVVLACFRHWRNSTIMLPDRNAHALIDEFTTRNRQMDGIYLLKLHALSALWNRTCETRLHLLVDSMDCKLKWSLFHHWKTLARQRMIDIYDDAQYLG